MDIQNLNMLTMIRLDVSTWSGRAKLSEHDLPSDVVSQMPPATLASIGSKKLYDPDKIKVFNTLKARAVSMLDKSCVRFLGGYATHKDKLPELANNLAIIATEFNSERDNFCQNYVQGVADWAGQFPQWAQIIINAVPKLHEIERKFTFSYQAFQIVPDTQIDSYAGSNLSKTITDLEHTVYEEVAADIREAYRECFENKEKVTKKAFRPLRTTLDKVRSLSFIHPHIASFEYILKEAIDTAEGQSADEKHVGMVKNFLLAVSTAQGVEAICEDFVRLNKTEVEVFDPFWVGTPKPETIQAPPPVFNLARKAVPAPLPPEVIRPSGTVPPSEIAAALVAIDAYELGKKALVMENDDGLW